MIDILRKVELKTNFVIAFLFVLILVFSLPGISALYTKPISIVDNYFESVSNYVTLTKVKIQIAAKDSEDLKNVINDIENPFENKMEDIKTGKKHYALKGCGTLHCHGPKGRGSGGPALNEGKFKHSDGSNYALFSVSYFNL